MRKVTIIEAEKALERIAAAANEWDQARRQLRRIVEPLEQEIERYRKVLWERLYGSDHGNRVWDELFVSEEHPAHAVRTVKQMTEITDAMRWDHREDLREYRLAVDMTRHCENQKRALEALIDDLKRVPLSKARKSPKDRNGKTVVPDMFD